MRFRSIFITGLSLFLGIMLGALVSGQTLWESPPVVEAENFGGLEFEDRQACMQKVGTFFISFLDADGFADYWTDYLVRNRCQQDDIFTLDREIEALIIELYETDCTASEFTEIQNEIREKKMEMYFVRHIVPAEEDTFFEKDVDNVDWSMIESALYDAMLKRYVEGKNPSWLEEEELDALFDEWKDQYEDRIPKYQSCDESPWQEVVDKTNELFETIKEFENAFNDIKEGAKERHEQFVEDTKERWEERGILNNGEFQGVGALAKGYLKKNIQVQVSLVGEPKSLKEIQEEFAEIGQALGFGDASSALSAEQFQYDTLTDSAELVAKYTLLYQQGSSQIGAHLRETIQTVQTTVRKSTNQDEDGAHLHGLKEAAKGIKDKQGKTSAG